VWAGAHALGKRYRFDVGRLERGVAALHELLES